MGIQWGQATIQEFRRNCGMRELLKFADRKKSGLNMIEDDFSASKWIRKAHDFIWDFIITDADANVAGAGDAAVC